MQAAVNRDFVSVDDYLAGERTGDVRHEYVGGAVYAMAGATKIHNTIALNICLALRAHARGGPCRTYMSDIKLRLGKSPAEVFYYPDVMVGCDPRDTHQLYLQHPKLIVEVSSESTERIDRHEKRLAYQEIETLEEYLIVRQERPDVTIFRRASNWTAEIVHLTTEAIRLNSLDFALPLSLVYEGVTFPG